jgi:hypothetical protein
MAHARFDHEIAGFLELECDGTVARRDEQPRYHKRWIMAMACGRYLGSEQVERRWKVGEKHACYACMDEARARGESIYEPAPETAPAV